MKKVALLFPGQGSQYVGMGKSLHEKYSVVRETFEEANEVLGFDIRNLCFEGSMEELTRTENTQPAILTTSVAMFKVYMQEIGVEPSYLCGHSLGEITSLTCAGGIKFSDAIKIVRNRGKFMQEAAAAGIGAMAAVSGLEKQIIKEECLLVNGDNNLVVISNYNSPNQIVISGHKNAVEEVGKRLKEKGGRITPLSVSAPFHSPLMKQAAERLKEELSNYEYSILKWPVLSNVTALPYEDSSMIIKNLELQITEPVQWQSIIQYLEKQGVELGIELGPKAVLKNLMKSNSKLIKCYAFDTEEDVLSLKEIAGENLNTEEKASKIKLIEKCIAIAVCTKNSNWDNDEYQNGVVIPYRRIQEMLLYLEKEGKEPTLEQMQDALEMLKSVLNTKRTPISEQIEKFNQVFDESGTRSLFPQFILPA
ncbi:ACP S-malonyltransferase [Ruminiclostridium herbifermentans]|uniref:[acyl-carrier-protein] S-malonyltransferase n=1 Tax=Ruminiclostridium herbifermentans TaxID=2488810 RepID=A0A4U7JJB7_9FIRM|nr:ACP S-malonyltransferase [Ruminiclostridium herbifermentans]QNU68463.1 ACP S-malonyltransferase [Ruminiclostridium herbifermentans]